jgi:thioredoxin 1
MMLTQVGQAGFHQDMEKRAGVSLVVFTQVSCGACRALKAVLGRAPPSPVAHLLEVDALDAAALTAEYDVFHLPAMFVFVQGVFQGPLHARPDATALQHAMDRLLSQPPQDPP